MRKNHSGFTLVELLVVVAIIGVLSTLTVVYLETARMSARDARRLADVKQIQLALKMYYNDLGVYPETITADASIANGGTNYLLRVPTNPSPRTDNDCPDEDYQYRRLDDGQRYSLAFCLGTKIDDLDPGPHAATHSGILNCPVGYVAVPGSATFDTNDFCVMKYEAKRVEYYNLTIGLVSPLTPANTVDMKVESEPKRRTIASVSSGYPIGNVSQVEAKSLCKSIGAHLITNPEWMTVARNLEQVNDNWSGGSSGIGSLNIGNAHATTAMDGANIYADGQEHKYRRTSYLSTRDTIWDFGGNVAEWVDSVCEMGEGADGCSETIGPPIEWTTPNLNEERIFAGPSNNLWDSNNNVGTYRGPGNGTFLRGGSIYSSDQGGIYILSLTSSPIEFYPLSGFRCVK